MDLKRIIKGFKTNYWRVNDKWFYTFCSEFNYNNDKQEAILLNYEGK